MLRERRHYILIHTPGGGALRETGILLYKDSKGTRLFGEIEAKNFWKSHFEGQNEQVSSLWTV